MSDLDSLKQTFLDADREYQFALASGDAARITASLTNWRKTFDAYNKAKRQQFKKSFQSKYSK